MKTVQWAEKLRGKIPSVEHDFEEVKRFGKTWKTHSNIQISILNFSSSDVWKIRWISKGLMMTLVDSISRNNTQRSFSVLKHWHAVRHMNIIKLFRSIRLIFSIFSSTKIFHLKLNKLIKYEAWWVEKCQINWLNSINFDGLKVNEIVKHLIKHLQANEHIFGRNFPKSLKRS